MNIIILPGWEQDSNLWVSLVEKLGKNASCLNLPGFGNEKLVDTNWNIHDYTHWVEGKINKNKKTVIIGHSFGGRIAAEIAGKNPKWLKVLVLSASPCLYRPSIKTKTRIFINKNLKYFVPENFRSIFLNEEYKLAKRKGMEKIFKNSVTYDQTNTLKKINLPTLLIWGSLDKDAPIRIAREMSELIKKSKLKIIDGAGHNAFLENPDLFFGYVKKFIDNL